MSITRCSNNYGPYQHPEKLIPLFVTNLLEGVPVPLYGDGRNIREWLHVDDHCRAIALVLDKGRAGEVYNVGGGNEQTNLHITERLLDLCFADRSMVRGVADRKGHDLRYSLDETRIREELGYAPADPLRAGSRRHRRLVPRQHRLVEARQASRRRRRNRKPRREAVMSDHKALVLDAARKYHEDQRDKEPFVPGVTEIWPSGAVLEEEDRLALVEAALEMRIAAGPSSRKFESRFARRLKRRKAHLTNSGSSANLLAMTAFTSHLLQDRRLKPGDEVITVAAGFPTTVNPILQNGLVPVFVDVELGTYNTTADRVARAIGPKTRAIMIAHALGNPFEAAEIAQLAEGARPVPHRGQLRRGGLHLRRTAHRHLR